MTVYRVASYYAVNGAMLLPQEVEAADGTAAIYHAICAWEDMDLLRPGRDRNVCFVVEEVAMHSEFQGRGWTVQQMGGGCLAYRLEVPDGAGQPSGRYFLMTCEGGGDLPGKLDEAEAMLGLYDAEAGQEPGGVDFVGEWSGTPAALLDRAEAMCIVARWVGMFGLGFHPDTPGADYFFQDGSACLSDEEAEQYDDDMATLFALPGDPYEFGLAEMERVRPGSTK